MKSIDSISEFHHLLSLPDPVHPLISVVRVEDIHITDETTLKHFFLNFYSVSLKKDVLAKMKYGQQYYDFNKGIMTFTSPKQIQSHEPPDDTLPGTKLATGYVLLFHPVFLSKHPLALQIKKYGFFSYAVSEALHLSAKEEKDIVDIFQKIEQEHQYIDHHTQDIILSQIDLLLNYCHRFYERQFITRREANNDLLLVLQSLLDDYFDNENAPKGLPTVQYLSEKLNISPHYLSEVLRTLTGRSTQQHIHDKLIEKAKELLTATSLSVGEIAYGLGFEYSQSFSKFFKSKTHTSPLEFRQSFN